MRAALFVLLFLTLAPLAAAAFPQTPPNDPEYAPAEAGDMSTCMKVSVNAEEHYLYSFMPKCAPAASDPEGAAGMSVDRAWAEHTIGSPDVIIAYVEGGINWHEDAARDLVNQVFLNRRELPLPQNCADYDCNGDGVFNVKDYAGDARVSDTNGNGYVDAEDLIVAFSDGTDGDANGFVDDISGWDFYDHQNDPATVDSTYDHANGQMRQAASEANNGFSGVGVCPGCRILPIKAGAEALDRTDDLAQAWLYADTIGASVVVSVTADLGYSSLMAQTVEKLWRDGVVMVEASNDFDSTDHQGGMFWPHVLPGNAVVSNSQNPGSTPFDNAITTTYRARSGYTSWGTHNMFSVATQGGTTSEATPTVGGVMALVLSKGRELSPPLTGPEAVQVVRATSSDINDPTSDWPSAPGWDLQYGYGRPNVLKAMQAIDAGAIPPVPSIDSPPWYTAFDPTLDQPVFSVMSTLSTRDPGGATWTLEWALGAQPADDAWLLAGSGTLAGGAGPSLVNTGNIALSDIPESFWSAPFRASTTKTLESSEQYTVTLRVTMTDASGHVGVDRRAIAVHHDPSLLLSRRFDASLESQPAIATLQGRTAIVFGDSDGAVHAVVGNSELPGWPVFTDAVVPHVAIGLRLGHEPVIAPVAVKDGLVLVPSTSGTLYAFDENGARLWSQRLDGAAVTPPIPRPAMPFTRLPHAGLTASPVLVDLNADGALDALQASWDGRLYALDAHTGAPLAGWPITVRYTGAPQPGHMIVNDAKLVATPAIADLDGDGRLDVVIGSQNTEVIAAGLNPLGVLHVFAFHADGTPVAGWPATIPSIVEYYGSAQEFITEGSTAPAVADVDHDGKDEVMASPVLSPAVLLNGDGRIRAVYGPSPGVADAPVTFTTSGAFGRIGGTLSLVAPGSGGSSVASALLLPGSGLPIQNFERAYDAATGLARPGFPASTQGLNFLGAPILADVDGDGLADVVDGGDSSALHAFNAAGLAPAGWPKFMGGWTLFSPAAGDVNGDGHTDIVTTTREGHLFVWSTPGDANAIEWGSYHGDAARTGRWTWPALPVPPTAWAPLVLLGGVVLWRRRSA